MGIMSDNTETVTKSGLFNFNGKVVQLEVKLPKRLVDHLEHKV